MAELFEIAELVKVAVEDERTGVAFYTAAAESAGDTGLKETFNRLAGEEKYHQKRFEEMLGALGGVRAREQYPGEYMAYLQTLTSTRAFPDEQTAMQMLADSAGDEEMVDLAARFERDTLMLMHEMQAFVPDKYSDIVGEITREEQGHLVTLAEARRQLTS